MQKFNHSREMTRPQRKSFYLLLALVSASYVPFLNFRMIRTAGDDKVYVSQIVEMARSGTWFLQLLNGRPDFYKGPLHYFLARIGIALFGFHMAATVYMNFVLVLLAAVALWDMLRRRAPNRPDRGLWLGCAFALNIGVYSFAYASQMETELCAFYVFALYALDRYREKTAQLEYWLIAGVMGWVKSPVYSVLLGLSGLLYWFWSGTLGAKLRAKTFWLAAISGVLICAVGFLPGYLSAPQGFIDTYLLRETLNKPQVHGTWDEALVALLTFFSLPWFWFAWVSYADAGVRLLSGKIRGPASEWMRLALSIMIPSVVFFMLHPYHGQSYNLPLMGALLLFVFAFASSAGRVWGVIYKAAGVLIAITFLLLPVGITLLANRYSPLPEWWPTWLLPVVWLTGGFGALYALTRTLLFREIEWRALAIGASGFYISLGVFLAVLGEREMLDLRQELKAHPTQTVVYSNLQNNQWCEGGYLNFMVDRPVRIVTREEDLFLAAKSGSLILVPDEGTLRDVLAKLNQAFTPQLGTNAKTTFEAIPWKRWTVVQWKDADGVPLWLASWRKHDLALLERDAFMIRVHSYL